MSNELTGNEPKVELSEERKAELDIELRTAMRQFVLAAGIPEEKADEMVAELIQATDDWIAEVNAEEAEQAEQ